MSFFQRVASPGSTDASTLVAALHTYPIFSGLSPETLTRLVPMFRVKEFSDEEIVCHCPDAKHDAFTVLDGKVALTYARGDDLHVVDLEGTGGVFNTAPLFDAPSNHLGARALNRVQVLAIDTEALKPALMKDAQSGYTIARNLGRLTLLQSDRLIQRLTD